MVKLDNNDLNYDDYDEYEGETRERFKSIDSNTQYRESMEDSRENEVFINYVKKLICIILDGWYKRFRS